MPLLPQLTPDTLEFVLLSFEGPDQYSMAGGLGVRMKELSLELARQGFRTHLVFVGDPDLPGREEPAPNLTLHRWCQWLSGHYRGGVYQGEEPKLGEWNNTVPDFVVSEIVRPAAAAGRLTAVLAEEWHTAHSVCLLSDQLWAAGLRDSAVVLWNANNTMGFDRIDWPRLDFCSQITTVSRYMKHIMWGRGVNPVVIPNGIPLDRVRRAPAASIAGLREAVRTHEILFKIGRWSPDKRWNMAVEALAIEREHGHDISMVIRGGVEPHALEVLHNAHMRGLHIVDLRMPHDVPGAIGALAAAPRADVYNVQSFMSDEVVSLLYSAADGVLANSGHEPFGLVGLEVMAASGLVFVGSTGEDYAVPFLNAVVLDSDDPTEISIALQYLREHPDVAERMRREARATAKSFCWATIIEDTLIGKLKYVAVRQGAGTPPPGPKPGAAMSETVSTGAASAYGGRVAGRQSVKQGGPRRKSAPRANGPKRDA